MRAFPAARTEPHTGRPKASRGPIRADLAVGGCAGSAWTLMLVPAFPETSPGIDFALAGIYLATYVAFCTLTVWAARVVTSSVSRRLLPGFEPLRAIGLVRRTILAGLLVPPFVLLGFAVSEWILPSVRAETQVWEVDGRTPPRSSRVTLIAMDGVDMRSLSRLVDEGRLPAFAGLLENGVAGPLATVSPHSPVVWTSIATGMPGSVHGVRRYTAAWLGGSGVALPLDRRDWIGRALNRLIHYRRVGPVSSHDRRARAIWDVLTLVDRESLVINWWATYPAEAIDGVMISNLAIPWRRIDEARVARQTSVAGLVSPESLRPELVGLLRGFLHDDRGDAVDSERQGGIGVEFFDLRDDLVFEMLDRFRSPEHALETVYVQGIDTASHAYTQTVFGENVNRRRPLRVPEAEAAALWDRLVAAEYERMDARLADLLARRAPDESLVVVSDHGWEYDGTSHWNEPPGVFLAIGPAFVSGVEIEGAHVYDVLPTLACVLGAPISRELPGKVLESALSPDYLAEHVPLHVASYGRRDRSVAFRNADAELDVDHLERLRRLGYLK